MARPSNFTRLGNFTRDAANGIIGATVSAATLDAELNQIAIELSQIRSVVNGITTVAGALTGATSPTAMSLVAAQRMVATAAQTVFVTTIPYDSAFTNLNVFVIASGVPIDPNLVTPANSAGFLQVTLPAQALSAVVVIEAFAAGAGVTTKLAAFDTAGSGTDLVGVYDPGGLIVATGLTTALQEIVGNLNTLTTNVGTTGQLIRATGTVPWTANQSVGGFRLTNLADGVGTQDAVTVNQFNQYGATLNALQTYFLRLDGTTVMAAALPMGNNKITGLAAGTISTDAATFGQVTGTFLPLAGGSITGNIVSNGVATLTGIPSAVNPSDAVPLSQAQSLVAPFSSLSDNSVAGAGTFVVPTGTTKIFVEQWGAGAGGQTGTPSSGSTGGSSGAYATAVITVTPGETLTLGIGAGGAAGANGGNTTIARGASVLLQCTGGTYLGAGGAATSPAGVPFWGITGQLGESGGALGGGSGANGSGGSAPRGGPGGASLYTNTTGVAGNAGVGPGGGGSGGGGGTAGSGAAGRIVIRY